MTSARLRPFAALARALVIACGGGDDGPSPVGPDPAPTSPPPATAGAPTGGTDAEVVYLVFPRSRVSPVESHDDAVRQGQGLARQFINANP